MDWTQLIADVDWTKLIVGIVSGAVVTVLGKWLGIKLDDNQRKAVDWAIEKGVAAAAARLWTHPGEARQAAAIKEAEALAPKAMAKLSEEQKRVVTDATYARMKASLPTPTSWVMRGSELPHATEDLGSSRPPPKEPP